MWVCAAFRLALTTSCSISRGNLVNSRVLMMGNANYTRDFSANYWEKTVEGVLAASSKGDSLYDRLYQASAKANWSSDEVAGGLALNSENPLGLPIFLYPLNGILGWNSKPADVQAAEM